MEPSSANRPRGLNFILGGSVVALAVLGLLILSGPIDLGAFGAPSVRIEDPVPLRPLQP